MKKRKICVFTGTRADYGPLKPLLTLLKHDKTVKLQILVTGTHLSPEFGMTYHEIEEDGFRVDEKIEMILSSDTPTGVGKSMGLGIAGMSEALERLRPDVLVVLGDRFEALAAAIAALFQRIPVAHISGGECTLGAMDESIRHSITKLSHLHFTTTKAYRKRVIQLGENPKYVYNVGEIGLDSLRTEKFLAKKELEDFMGVSFAVYNLLITFHPVTLEYGTSSSQFNKLLHVLGERSDTLLIFTKSNADMEGRLINGQIDSFVREHANAVVFTSLGRLKYLSLLQFVDAVVGNSSSGIIEAPSFRIGTLNIGSRQEGRIRSASVIDCEPQIEAIRKGFDKLYSSRFQAQLRSVKNPYDGGGSAKQVSTILKEIDLSALVKKKFFDVHFAI